MDRDVGTVLRGVWGPGVGVRQVDAHGRLGGPLRPGGLPLGYVVSEGRAASLRLGVGLPGVHGLYYAIKDGRVYWDEQSFRLRRTLGGKASPKIVQVTSGCEHTVTNGVATVTKVDFPVGPALPYTSLAEAIPDFKRTFVEAVSEQYEAHGRGRVAVMLSAGVDSILVLWALREIGADVVTMTAGREGIDDFDPLYAGKVAEHFGAPWVKVTLPSTDDALSALLARTLGIIEQTAFSQVLMGLCSTLLNDLAVQQGARVQYLGYMADAMFGNKPHVVGRFEAKPEAERTDRAWTLHRLGTSFSSHHTGNEPLYSMQTAKSFRAGGLATWRSPFLHPHLYEFILRAPLSVVPPLVHAKPLLYRAMESELPEALCPWHVRHKCGFYNGSGASKIRLANPILQDKNISAVFAQVRRHLSTKA